MSLCYGIFFWRKHRWEGRVLVWKLILMKCINTKRNKYGMIINDKHTKFMLEIWNRLDITKPLNNLFYINSSYSLRFSTVKPVFFCDPTVIFTESMVFFWDCPNLSASRPHKGLFYGFYKVIGVSLENLGDIDNISFNCTWVTSSWV